MKRTSKVLLALFIAVLPQFAKIAMAQEGGKSTFSALTGKKLIEYGWDVPTPKYIQEHIREMENRPFEGIIFKLPASGGNVFNPDIWDKNQAAIQDSIKVLPSIKWEKFTDNFLAIYSASTMDWFSDADWKKVLAQTEFCAKAAKAARCKGLMFDPEPYGTNPWHYGKQKHADKYSYDEYAAKVRQRGRQFMQTIQKEMPEATLLFLYQYEFLYNISHHPDRKVNEGNIKWNPFGGLLMPFLDGMLEEAGPSIHFVAGNEHGTYYFTKPSEYFRAYWITRQGAVADVPPDLRDKYIAQSRAGSTVYADYIFNTFGKFTLSRWMTPEERTHWFEHNIYYALQTSDEYVWLYNEKMNWWTGKDLPPDIEEAIVSAKTKLEQGQDLGYSMDAILQKAQTQYDQSLQANLQQRSAVVLRLNAAQSPKIDGNLNEKIYLQPWMGPFVGFAQSGKSSDLKAATWSFASYDDNNLYIAFRCNEPLMAEQQVVSHGRDSGSWGGESVEVSILRPGQPTDDSNAVFYHLILNPANDQWDALNTGNQPDVKFNLSWKSAVNKNPAGWTGYTVEIAIPWKELGIDKPYSGLQIHANFSRQRMVPTRTELSSWSQFVAGFQEPQNFGILTLQ